jgi:hypothetical protein
MNNEKLHIEALKNKLGDKKSINIDDFYMFYKDIYTDIKKSTVRWYVYGLKEEKVIKNVSRGIYTFEDNQSSNVEDYVVITLDIIDSSLESYEEFDVHIAHKVDELNRIMNKRLNYDRRFYISQGDELQILCPFDDRLSELIMTVMSCLHPYKIRFAISIGNIQQTEIVENSWDMNGPIFWNARDTLNTLKKSKQYDGIIASEYLEVDRTCNKLLRVILILINRISSKQWEAIYAQQKYDDTKDIIKQLGISQSSYYDRISGSNVDDIIDGLDGVFDLLERRRNYS